MRASAPWPRVASVRRAYRLEMSRPRPAESLPGSRLTPGSPILRQRPASARPSSTAESTGKSYIVETVGCGAAFFDFDNDGWLDIFLLSGTTFDGSRKGSNRLYRNNRDGTFTDVTAKRRTGPHRVGSAVAVGDYNNDGFEDLFVTYWGQNVLYRNNGDGTFTDVTREPGCCTRAPLGIRVHLHRLRS